MFKVIAMLAVLASWTLARLAPTPAPFAVAHQPWCAEHEDGTIGGLLGPEHIHPDDQMCQRRFRGTYGEILLTYTADDGPMVNLYGRDYEMKTAAAREFLRDVTAAVRAAEQSRAL